MPGDEFQGDVNYRTLQALLTRVDQRGYERYRLRFKTPDPCLRALACLSRSAHQLEFHEAFLRATARVIYRGEWESSKPMIMRKHGWDAVHSEVMISTPRRFGKTFR